MERLDSRLCLSGAVHATIAGGNLNIRGDNGANSIVVDQLGLTAGQLRISGGPGSSINGQADPVVLSGITKRVSIRMGKVADAVVLRDVSLPGGLVISSGLGAGTVTLDNVRVQGTTKLSTSRDDVAAVTIDDSLFHGDVQIGGGRSADRVLIDVGDGGEDGSGPPTVFDGRVTVALRGGDDVLQLGVANQAGHRSEFTRDVNLAGGAGSDTLVNFNASSYTGSARFRVSNFEVNRTAFEGTVPTVSSTDPAVNAGAVATNKKISATFSEAMDPQTITSASVLLTGPGGTPVEGTLAYAGTTLTFTPAAPLAPNTTYTLTITTAVTDLAGNALAANFVGAFTTGATPDMTAPVVSFTNPGNAAADIAVNKKVAVTFSEAMDPLTVSAATVTLTAPGGVPVAGTVSYAGTIATFTATNLLSVNTTYIVSVTTEAKDLAGNALESLFSSSFTTGQTSDVTSPTVSSTDPANATDGVAVNKKVSATFSEPMDPLTLTTAAVTLTDPQGVPVAGAVAYAGTTLVFTPSSPLASSTAYTLTITTAAKDLAGNPLATNFADNFTTGTTPDVTAPTVTLTDPADTSAGVALNKKISATFSESMDPLTLTTATVTLTAPGGVPVSGAVVYVGRTVTFTPTEALAANITYILTITSGAADLADNTLASTFAASFTTGNSADTTAPAVSSTNPANGEAGVAPNTKVSATFSETMDPATITAAEVTLTPAGGGTVPCAVAYVGSTMTLTPSSPLAASTVYTLTITTGAKDLAGNPLATTFTDSFTTGTAPDTTAPSVTLTDPADTSVGVALNKKVSATFSESMDPLTLTTATVTLTDPQGVLVPGAVAYAGTTMVFTPSATLAASTVYTLVITTAAKDLAGNPLAANFSDSFTTGIAPDTTVPSVTLTDPADAAVGVALNKKVSATFSESMDPLTLTTATVTLTDPQGVPVAGAVAYAGSTMVFTPNVVLLPTSVYTLAITTAAKDLAGNSLAANFSYSFTTGLAPDVVPPLVTLTDPVDLKTNFFINQPVIATFSESMDPLTITNALFTVTDPNGVAVPATVAYDAIAKTATLRPTGNLAINTTFTARIVGGVNGVKDLAGNPLALDKVWTFTTGNQIAQPPIVLGAAGTFAVMATASIVSTGPTVINGDVGLSPGTAQGIPPNQVNGIIHVNDQAIINAQAALLAAYNDAVSRSVTPVTLPGNMGGLTFTPGLYSNSSSVLIQGAGPSNIVTLDAQGDPNAIFIFQMGSTLTTGPGAQIVLAGGAKASNIYWQVGTSATLDTATIFKGNIIASVTITVNTGSAIEGRLLGGSSSAGSVTIDASTVTVPAT